VYCHSPSSSDRAKNEWQRKEEQDTMRRENGGGHGRELERKGKQKEGEERRKRERQRDRGFTLLVRLPLFASTLLQQWSIDHQKFDQFSKITEVSDAKVSKTTMSDLLDL